MRHLWKKLWPFLFIIAICVALTPHPLQNDTFYLVKIGDYIWHHGLDFRDHFSWVADFSYTYPHLLFNLLCFGAYSLCGFSGLYILSILLYIIFALSLFRITKVLLASSPSHFVQSVLPFLFTLLATVLLTQFITARSQTLTYTLFLWELYFLEQLVFAHRSPRKYLILLTLDSWLIALSHAITWPLFFILFLPFLAELLLIRFLTPSSIHKKRRLLTSLAPKLTLTPLSRASLRSALHGLALATVFSLIAGLLTPSRICFTAIFRIMQASSQFYISEHQPLVLANLLCAAVPLLIFLSTLIFTRAKLSTRWFCLFVGLTILSFASSRHVALLISLGAIPLAYLLADLSSLVSPQFLFAITQFTPWRLLLSTVLILSTLHFFQELDRPLLTPDLCPVAAADFIQSHFSDAIASGSFRLFNEYDHGAYLLFRDIPVFIDSRANIYTTPFSLQLPRDILNDYQLIIHAEDTSYLSHVAEFPADGPSDYLSLIAYYQPTHFLLRRHSTLAKVLTASPSYLTLYTDGTYILLAPLPVSP